MLFDENLKRICSERGTYPSTVLKELGLSTSKVSAWNSGSLPKQDVLIQLAKRLDCSVMDFFITDEERALEQSTSDAETTLLDEDEVEMVRIFRKLSRRDRHEFMSVVYEFERKAELSGDSGSNSCAV